MSEENQTEVPVANPIHDDGIVKDPVFLLSERVAKLEMIIIQMTTDMQLLVEKNHQLQNQLKGGIGEFIKHLGESLIASVEKRQPAVPAYQQFHLEHIKTPDRVTEDTFVLFRWNEQVMLARLWRVLEISQAGLHEINTIPNETFAKAAVQIPGMNPSTLTAYSNKYGDRALVNIFKINDKRPQEDVKNANA